MITQRLLVLGLCCVGLPACNTMNYERDYSYETSGGYYGASTPLNAETSSSYSYNTSYEEPYDQDLSSRGQDVNVPETYHVGFYHAPVPAKDRDKAWVFEQSPQGYTIEIGDSEKASQVASQLVQAPKKERVAEVPYLRHGTQHYKGLYGSFATQEAAQQALDALPNHLKQQAGVKSWRDVQGVVE